jgi:hypothetical protein
LLIHQINIKSIAENRNLFDYIIFCSYVLKDSGELEKPQIPKIVYGLIDNIVDPVQGGSVLTFTANLLYPEDTPEFNEIREKVEIKVHKLIKLNEHI